jgi:hypothetical protein
MADCEHMGTCSPFFDDKMNAMPAMADLYKARYCLNDCTACARFAVFQVAGGANVPIDLFPNDLERVSALLA